MKPVLWRRWCWRRWLWWCLSWLAGCCVSVPAGACTFSESGGTLPDVSSFAVRTGPGITGSGSLQLTCSSVVLTLLGPAPSVTANITSPTTGLTLKNGSDSIPYTITSGTGLPYTVGQLLISVNGAAAVGLLTNAGSRVPINIVTGTSANVAAGTYTDTVTVRWSYANICEGVLAVGGLCLGGTTSAANVMQTLIIRLTVTNDCAINAPPIQFGSKPMLNAFPVVNQNIGLLCTKGLVYTVGLSAGNNAAGGRRQMASGTNRLQYDIYKPNGTVWGVTDAARAASIGAADGINSQLMPYSASIHTDQPAPAAGTYTDSITVDVGF